MKKVAIIGCGASGLVCAIVCAKAGLKVDIYEKNDKCAKKILISGNGKCNITNKNLYKEAYFGDNLEVVDEVLKRFDYKAQEKFFKSLGILFEDFDDGRVFPTSFEAKTVAFVLENYAKNLGVNIFKNKHITSIKDFIIEEKKYDVVVLASGSKAANHLGSNESGYKLAKSFYHDIKPLYPSLVQLVSSSKLPKIMSGVKLNADITLFINGAKEQTINGDLLFSDYGLSGLGVLDISFYASKALSEYAYMEVVCDLLPKFPAKDLASHLQNISKKLDILHSLHTVVPLKVAKTILKELQIEPSLREISIKEAKKIAHTLKNLKFEITDTKGFRYAEVCGGGVDTSQINPKTFESKKQKNLYIIGEVLDVVGKRGGYNFAFAWGSGYLAGCDIIAKNK